MKNKHSCAKLPLTSFHATAKPSFISSLRLQPESFDPKTPFASDLEKILHSTYFRRLQGKTQVWAVHESDFFRTRLTHSLETAHIGRQIARQLNLDENLVEALCLAHDLGHPPFAHEGARLLDHFAKQHSNGRVCFDDNAQNLRILVRLASGGGDEGLNPSASMIDGLIKYKRTCSGSCGWYPEEDEVVAWAARLCATGMQRNPLASIVEIADDLAYACHDVEDAIRAGMIHYDMLEEALDSLTSEKARQLVQDSLGTLLKEIAKHRSTQALRDLRHRVHHALLNHMLKEILQLSASSDFHHCFFDPAYHETLNPYLAQLPHIAELLEVLKELVLERVINEPNIQTLRFASLCMMEDYLNRFWPRLIEPHHPLYRHALLSLPREWQVKFGQTQTKDAKLRLLLDYVSGMSDEYLLQQAHMFFDPTSHKAIENRK